MIETKLQSWVYTARRPDDWWSEADHEMKNAQIRQQNEEIENSETVRAARWSTSPKLLRKCHKLTLKFQFADCKLLEAFKKVS